MLSKNLVNLPTSDGASQMTVSTLTEVPLKKSLYAGPLFNHHKPVGILSLIGVIITSVPEDSTTVISIPTHSHTLNPPALAFLINFGTISVLFKTIFENEGHTTTDDH